MEKSENFNLKEYVFHSHTYRCGHARKDIEDYVTEAIKQGYKKFGASDHVFLPGIIQPSIRGDYSFLSGYMDEFKRCKALYGNQIEMYLGFECEYSDAYKKYYKSLLRDRGFDYLICGQHLAFNNDFTEYWYFTDNEEKQEPGLLRYRDDVINGIKSGLFLYIAHPDLFFICCRKVTPIYEQITKEIIDAAIKYDVPIEVNINGLLRPRIKNGVEYLEYPCDYFWKQASKTNVKIVYGGDFHNPDNISNEELYKKAEDLIKRCGVKLSDINQIYKNYQDRIKKILKE